MPSSSPAVVSLNSCTSPVGVEYPLPSCWVIWIIMLSVDLYKKGMSTSCPLRPYTPVLSSRVAAAASLTSQIKSQVSTSGRV